MRTHPLGRFEELILRAVEHLQTNAYGISIKRCVGGWTGRAPATGAVYTSLTRLVRKGYLKSKIGAPTPVPGGRAKRYYTLEDAGARAIEKSRSIEKSMNE